MELRQLFPQRSSHHPHSRCSISFTTSPATIHLALSLSLLRMPNSRMLSRTLQGSRFLYPAWRGAISPSVRASTRTLSHSTYPTNPPHSSNSQDLYSTQLLYAYEAVGSVRLDRDVLHDGTGFPRSEPRMRLGTVREPGYPHMYPRIARTRQRLRGVFVACGGHIWTRRLGVCEILGSC